MGREALRGQAAVLSKSSQDGQQGICVLDAAKPQRWIPIPQFSPYGDTSEHLTGITNGAAQFPRAMECWIRGGPGSCEGMRPGACLVSSPSPQNCVLHFRLVKLLIDFGCFP